MKNTNDTQQQALQTIGENISYIYNLVNYDSRKTYIFTDDWTFRQACESAEKIEEQLRKVNNTAISSETEAYIDDVREIIEDNKRYYDGGEE